MERNIFRQGYEEAVKDFNKFTNDIIGVLAFTLGLTSLSLGDNATSFASWSASFLIFFVLFKHFSTGQVLKRYYKGFSWLKYSLSILMGNPVYVFGITFLFLVAFGIIDIEFISSFSFAK